MANKGKYARSKSPLLQHRKPPIREEIPESEDFVSVQKERPVSQEAPGAEAPAVQKPRRHKAPPAPEPALQEEVPLTPLQKAWNLVTTVFTYLIMALAVVMMLFTAISVSSFDRNDRDILGYKFFIVRSDSMSATDFSAGDLVVIREVDPAGLKEGDIIAFRSEDPGSLGETFTHKIRSFTTDDYGIRTFVTYGTTTGVDDAYPVPQQNILGQYRFSIPKMGNFFAFMKTGPGYLCCIGLPFLIMLLIQGGNSVRYAREIYREKQREEQAKLDALHTRLDKLEQQNQELREILHNLYHRLPPQ